MLKLEFTETAMADDPRAVHVLEACRELGVQVWVDDFGTGYSSLAYLQRFPINGLKLDKSFVDPLDGTPQSASMARAILQIAQSIGVDAIAEGIETEAQREQLRTLGYQWGQGYLFSRPLRVGDAYRMLATR
jgi:EAL domain-containing protein (putative c-di-GMP-specific phosphodiesterase class I)